MPPSPSLKSSLTQTFPPKPGFTEKDLPDLHGKVYIVTGASAGIGKQVAQLLYSKNAKVYLASRSESKTNAAIEEINRSAPQSKGSLVYLRLDLADLTNINASAEEFLSKEKRLDVLFNNAGVMASADMPARTPQGHDLQIGTNCLGPFLFTKVLTPLLVATAKIAPPSSVRVVWLSSFGAEVGGDENVGVSLDNIDFHNDKPLLDKYSLSKAGNYLQAVEFAKRHKKDGVVSLAVNPGNLVSELFDHQPFFFRILAKYLLGYPPINGAYTEIFAGLSPDVTLEKTGSWIAPFGRIHYIRKDLQEAAKTKAEGGSGGALDFWEWNEAQVKDYC